jgi:broad specificity phosphatase PhoE
MTSSEILGSSQYLYFIRHGQTEWNAIHRMQGQWNSDLNALGRSQADRNGRLLAKLGVDAIFASPLDRTRQTAEIINRYLSLPVTYDDRIMEWDCGDWSGHLYAEVQQKWPGQWQAYQADRFNYRGPNCENFHDMIARSTPFIEELRTHPARRIAIVSHGLIGKIMVSTLLGLSEHDTLAFGQDNDVVFRLKLDGSENGVDQQAANQAGITADHFVNGKGPYPGHQASRAQRGA